MQLHNFSGQGVWCSLYAKTFRLTDPLKPLFTTAKPIHFNWYFKPHFTYMKSNVNL